MQDIFSLGENTTFGYDVKNQPTKPKSNANVRTAKLSEIHYIERKDLQDIFETYPKFAFNFRHIYQHGYDLNDIDEVCINNRNI